MVSVALSLSVSQSVSQSVSCSILRCVCHDIAWSGRVCGPLPSGGLRLDRPCQLFEIMMCVPRHCMVWAGPQSTPQWRPAIWQTLSVVRYYDVCAATLHGLCGSAVHSPSGGLRFGRPRQLFDIMMCVPRHCMVWTGLRSTPQWGPAT